MLSVLDIILICLGATAVIIYAILSIRKAIKYRKEYQSCLESGMTPLQAKEYCDRFFSKKKKDKQDQADKIFEE